VPTETVTRKTAPAVSRWAWPLAIAAIGGLMVGLVVGGGATEAVADEIAGAGPLVGWGLPSVRLLATAAGVLTVGLLMYAAVLGPQGRKGVLSQVGRADVVRAGWMSLVWSVASFATSLWALAWALGLPLSSTLSPQVISTYAWSVDSVRAFFIVGLLAAAIAIGALFTSSVSAAAAWGMAALIGVALPALTGHASSLGSHGVAMTSDVVHAVSMAVWVGGLLVILFHAVRNDPATMRALPIFRTVATWAVVFLAVSGLGASFARMNSFSELLTTPFGFLIVAKVTLLAALLVTARTLQTKVVGAGLEQRTTLIRFAGIEAVLMALAAGLGVPSPRPPTRVWRSCSRRMPKPCSAGPSHRHRVLPPSCSAGRSNHCSWVWRCSGSACTSPAWSVCTAGGTAGRFCGRWRGSRAGCSWSGPPTPASPHMPWSR
jgi:putative copper resistance protein D